MTENSDLHDQLKQTKSLNKQVQQDNRCLQDKVQQLQTKLQKALQYLDHYKNKERSNHGPTSAKNHRDTLSSNATASSYKNTSSAQAKRMEEKNKNKFVGNKDVGFSYMSLVNGDHQRDQYNWTHHGFKQNMYD